MSEDQRVPPVARQEVVPLSGGWNMVTHVTEAMCDFIWCHMDEGQRDELRALYGDDDAAQGGMWKECSESGHKAAFYDGLTLVCVMWAEWTDVVGLGRRRVLGCFCNSKYAREHPMAFAKKTPECRDAFELYEPPDVSELYVFIAKEYGKSRKWAVMFGGCEESFYATNNGRMFVCYKRTIGGK